MSTNTSDVSPLLERTTVLFSSSLDRIGPIISPFVAAASTFLETTWLAIFWTPLFYLIKKYYLLAPQWLGGMENRPAEDICSNILGVPSTVLFTELGQKICQDKINSKVTSFVTVIIALVVAVLAVNAFVFLKSSLFFRVQRSKTHNNNNNNSSSNSSGDNGGNGSNMDQLIELMNLRKFGRWSMLKVNQVKACKEILRTNMSQAEQINALRLVLFPAGRRSRGNTLLLESGPYGGLPIDSDEDEEDNDMIGFPGVIAASRISVSRRRSHVVVAAAHEEAEADEEEEVKKKPNPRGRRKTLEKPIISAATVAPPTRRASKQ